MKIYLLSLATGVLVGVVYSLLGVRSPAPPVMALVGLLGILVGEQALPLVRSAMGRDRQAATSLGEQSRQHVFGSLPGHGAGAAILATSASRTITPDPGKTGAAS